MDRVFWNTTGLASNYTTSTFKSVQRIPECNLYPASRCETTEVRSILHLTSAHGADNGYITCLAENIVGKGIDNAFLKINCESIIRLVSPFHSLLLLLSIYSFQSRLLNALLEIISRVLSLLHTRDDGTEEG